MVVAVVVVVVVVAVVVATDVVTNLEVTHGSLLFADFHQTVPNTTVTHSVFRLDLYYVYW